jgi:hypothetical protein
MDPIAVSVFQKIAKFEILLRRFVRWQLMALHGKGWLISIGDHYYEQIESRISIEKNQGIYWSKSSELSFLTLRELINIIFNELWKTSAKDILENDYGLKSALNHSIVPLRNKVAHFRAIDEFDLRLLEYADEIRVKLQNYYSNQHRVQIYISSDPAFANEQMDEEIIADIKNELAKISSEYFFDEYGKFESIRVREIGCGFGIYDFNLFVELSYSYEIPNDYLFEWFDQNRFVVSSIVLDSNKVRIFLPNKNTESDTRKVMQSLYKQIINYSSRGNLKNLYQSEYIVNTNTEKPVGLAF